LSMHHVGADEEEDSSSDVGERREDGPNRDERRPHQATTQLIVHAMPAPRTTRTSTPYEG
jgi:hypothetical protein